MTHFQYAPLRKFAFEVLTHFGFNPENATLASDVLWAADLRGIDSHGVARLIGYIRL
ncbi:MAG: Ldh family oxidoreductase, partial [Bacteroidota bacterium]